MNDYFNYIDNNNSDNVKINDFQWFLANGKTESMN